MGSWPVRRLDLIESTYGNIMIGTGKKRGVTKAQHKCA